LVAAASIANAQTPAIKRERISLLSNLKMLANENYLWEKKIIS